MKHFSLRERAEFYEHAFQNWPAPKVDQEDKLRVDDRWIDGIWILGQDYRGSGYYGSYPPNYLKRMSALFPDADNILHLFSGSLPPGDYTRVDLNPSYSDMVCDAQELSSYFEPEEFDLIFADPPYTEEDANKYGTPWINRNVVIKECEIILSPGGYLVWLDQVLPMFRKDQFYLCGAIGIVRSTNHRFRVASIFRKLPK